MIRFESDYTEGAHERILKRLIETNGEQTSGYGTDGHTERAKSLIKLACEAPGADVHLLVGGTQTNTTVIAAALRPHQGVIAAVTGHIAAHESGAIEATGHKVLTLPSEDGKISASQVQAAIAAHWNDATHEHTVQPGMVYISQPTENGTLYVKEELEALYKVCREYGLPLFVDGARLGYALASEECDCSLPELAKLCDVFYIGGTKVGAMMGEAVVIISDSLKKDFRYMIKQKGGLLAKGRMLGIQFETLFEDGLYMDISKHAVELAMKLHRAFAELGISFRYHSTTNQQFPVLPDRMLESLREKYSFSYWEPAGEGRSVVRFCTSWATKEEHVAMLIEDVRGLVQE